MPTFTIYVTGSNEYFYAVLNGVAMGLNNGDLFWSVVRTGALFALITGSWHAMSKHVGSGLMRSHSWIENAIVLVLVTSCAFVPTRVIVQDIYGDQNATPIDNVPLLLSAPATVFSSIGFDAFRAMDTWFQSTAGSSMSVSENGFVTPLRLMLSMRSDMDRVAPELYQSWFNFIADCTPKSSVATGLMNQSKDIAQYLYANGNDNGFVKTYLAANGTQLTTDQLVTCNVAKDRLAVRMDALTVSGTGTNGMSDLDRMIQNNMSEEKQGGNKKWSYANDFVPAYNTYSLMMGNAAQSAQEYMRNSLMRSVVVDAYRCATSNMSANDQMLCAQAQHDAVEQYKVDSAGMGSWFSGFMLPMMTILQLLFFAYSVIALLYAVLRGAGALSFLTKYLLFAAWVFSWLPFVAIINAFIQWMVTDKLATLSGTALTLENYSAYYEVMSKNLALASTMLASTPILTLGLMSGSIYAFSGFAQKMSGQDYMQERNLAPNNVDVSPVTRMESQYTHDAFLGQRTGATSLPQVGVGSAIQHVASSRREEMVNSQIGTLESFQQMVSAQRASGGATQITNSEGVTASVSDQKAFNEGAQKIRSYGESGGFKQEDIANAEARFKLGFSLAGNGGSVGAGLSKAIAGSENQAVNDLLSHGIGASAQYAETAGKQLASQVQSSSSDSNSKTRQAAANFTEQSSRSASAARAYSEISSQSSGVRTDQVASVNQLGSMIHQDELLGSGGSQIRQQIDSQYEKLVESQGPNGREFVDGAVGRKMQQWRSTGAEFSNMGDVARLMVLQDLGATNAHAGIVAGMFSTSSHAATAAPMQYAGVGSSAQNVAPQGGYGHLNDRVESAQPGTGAGRASSRDLTDLKSELRSDNPVPADVRRSVLPRLSQAAEDLPEGVMDPGVTTPRQATGKVLAQQTAKDNLMNPAETETEMAAREAAAKLTGKITGVEQPPPIASNALLNQRRERDEAAASHPADVRGSTPQARDNNLSQRLADLRRERDLDNEHVLEQNRVAALGARGQRAERESQIRGDASGPPHQVAMPYPDSSTHSASPVMRPQPEAPAGSANGAPMPARQSSAVTSSPSLDQGLSAGQVGAPVLSSDTASRAAVSRELLGDLPSAPITPVAPGPLMEPFVGRDPASVGNANGSDTPARAASAAPTGNGLVSPLETNRGSGSSAGSGMKEVDRNVQGRVAPAATNADQMAPPVLGSGVPAASGMNVVASDVAGLATPAAARVGEVALPVLGPGGPVEAGLNVATPSVQGHVASAAADAGQAIPPMSGLGVPAASGVNVVAPDVAGLAVPAAARDGQVAVPVLGPGGPAEAGVNVAAPNLQGHAAPAAVGAGQVAPPLRGAGAGAGQSSVPRADAAGQVRQEVRLDTREVQSRVADFGSTGATQVRSPVAARTATPVGGARTDAVDVPTHESVGAPTSVGQGASSAKSQEEVESAASRLAFSGAATRAAAAVQVAPPVSGLESAVPAVQTPGTANAAVRGAPSNGSSAPELSTQSSVRETQPAAVSTAGASHPQPRMAPVSMLAGGYSMNQEPGGSSQGRVVLSSVQPPDLAPLGQPQPFAAPEPVNQMASAPARTEGSTGSGGMTQPMSVPTPPSLTQGQDGPRRNPPPRPELTASDETSGNQGSVQASSGDDDDVNRDLLVPRRS